ncbi:MAG: tetratricopeptide repeat protein [Candidatus Hodarchaeales archaeon]
MALDDQEVSKLTPIDFIHLNRKGEFKKVLKFLEGYENINETFFIKVDAFFGLGRYKQAQNYLNSIKEKLDFDNPLIKGCWYYQLARCLIFREGNFDQGLKHSFKALELVSNSPRNIKWVLNHTTLIGLINLTIGEQYRFLGDFKNAYHYVVTSKDIFGKDNNQTFYYSTAIHQLGVIHSQKDNLDQALDLFEEALLIREEYNNSMAIGLTLNAIGGIYASKGEYSEAWDYYINAYELSKEQSHPNLLYLIYVNLGSLESIQGRLSNALNYYQQAFEIQKELDNPIWKAYILESMAMLLLNQANANDAFSNLKEAKKIYQKLNKIDGIADIHLRMALVLKTKALYVEAKEEIEQALNIYLEENNPIMISFSLLELAFIEYELKLSIRDSVDARFPPPPYENPMVNTYKDMIDALIAQQEKNYGIAWNLWKQILHYKDLTFNDQIRTYEALIEITIQDWQREKNDSNLQKVLIYLNKLESLSMKQNLSPLLCKTYLIRSKIDQTQMKLSEAKKWIEKCLEIAKNSGLPNHFIQAQNELKKVDDLEQRMQQELISNIAIITEENPETVKNYLHTFTEQLVSHSQSLKSKKLAFNDSQTEPLTIRKIEKSNQINQILAIFDHNPLGVYQKDLPKLVGLSKATISRRINELLNQGVLNSSLEGRSRLLMLKSSDPIS